MRLACLLLTACAVAGCGGGGGSGGGSTAAGVASATPGTTSSSSVTRPRIASLVIDETLVPSGPPDAPWYFREDDPTTPDNEAARDLARAIAATPNGLSETFVHDHLTRGGGLAIFVGGTNHERDTPARRSSWIVSYAPHVYEAHDLPALQVDYWDRTMGTGVPPLDLAFYNASFHQGVLRTAALVRKALSAGAGEVRLYGQSKGGDIVQEVTWLLHDEPRLTFALALGLPLWSAAIPEVDAAGPYRRGGLFHVGRLRARDYAGKLVVFNRLSDRVSHGELWPPHDFPGPGHDYKTILLEPRLRDALDRAWQAAAGWEDRSLGQVFDY